jgi:hypothetical protein
MRNFATPAIYALDAALLIFALWFLRRAQRSGNLERWSARKLTAFAAALGLVTLLIAEPLRGPFQDFVDAYYSGGRALLEPDFAVASLFRNDVHGFVNVPIVAVFFVPFALLPSRVAALIFFALGVIALYGAWRLLVEIGALDRYRASILAVLMLTNGPLMNSLKEGNTSHFALLAMAYALLNLRRGKCVRAGLVLGASAVFKLPLVLYGVWAFLRGRFSAALAGGAVIAAVGLASVAAFGFDVHVLWYRNVVAAASETPLGAFNVQSFPAAFLRVMKPDDVMCSWDGVPMPAGVRTLASAASLALVGLCAVAAILPRLRGGGSKLTDRALETEFALVGLLACTTSPLAWSHYYAWTLLPIALALRPGAPELDAAHSRRFAWYCAVGLCSLSVAWPWCEPYGAFATPYALFSSHYLIAAVLLIVLLCVERATVQPSATEASRS